MPRLSSQSGQVPSVDLNPGEILNIPSDGSMMMREGESATFSWTVNVDRDNRAREEAATAYRRTINHQEMGQMRVPINHPPALGDSNNPFLEYRNLESEIDMTATQAGMLGRYDSPNEAYGSSPIVGGTTPSGTASTYSDFSRLYSDLSNTANRNIVSKSRQMGKSAMQFATSPWGKVKYAENMIEKPPREKYAPIDRFEVSHEDAARIINKIGVIIVKQIAKKARVNREGSMWD